MATLNRGFLYTKCYVCGRKSVAIVNASTLTLKGTKTISISRKMAGSKYKGLSSIAYNYEKNFYIVKLKGNAN